MPKFIHFGCWNKGGCYLDKPSKGWNDLSSVMRNLREVSESHYKPEFVVVAGDNYYPTYEANEKTGESQKKIVTKDLMSGLECLPDNLPVHILLGNHDVESDVIVDNNNHVKPSQECYILDKETEFVRSRRETTSLNTYNSRIFNNNTLVLMIDTTIYADDEELGLKCYRHMYENNSITLDTLRNDQKLYVESIISELPKKIKNIVIIGHFPITGYKTKNKKTNLIQTPGYNFANLLYESIFENIKPKKRNKINYYYLCADLHQYQIGNIEIIGKKNNVMNIKQYIVGTGGTTLDPYPFVRGKNYNMREIEFINKNDTSEHYNIKYLMTDEQIKLSGSKHGFLECHDINGTLAFNFIDIQGNNFTERMYSNLKRTIVGGKRRKKTHKIPIIKKNKKNGLNIIEFPKINNYLHDGNIDFERFLNENADFNRLLSTLEEYNDGFVYISIGSTIANGSKKNNINQLVPLSLVTSSLKRENANNCQKKSCKTLCIAIDSLNINNPQLDYETIIKDKIKDSNIQFILLDIKSIINNKQDILLKNKEVESFFYTLFNKIKQKLQEFKINNKNLKINNYLEFNNSNIFKNVLNPYNYENNIKTINSTKKFTKKNRNKNNNKTKKVKK